jgi:putative ABC transport system permease protein
MTIGDLFSETYSNLFGNKVRSGLTMLGIVIGIGSVIALVSVGQGATAKVTSSITSLGTNLLTISPTFSRTAGPVRGGAGSATTLTTADVTALEKQMTYAAAIAPVISSRYQVTYSGSNTNAQVIGTEPTYTTIRNVTVASGSFFSDQQVQGYSKVAIIGATIRDDLFGEGADPIGLTIKINKIQFKVIGVTATQGGSEINTSDNSIFIPLTTAQRFLAGRTSLSSIYIQAVDENSLSAAQQEATAILLEQHNISDASSADFRVQNQADLVSSLTSTTSTLTLLLGAIAGISLLVGGIGIMNMMLTTVTERTKEIGLRKAIGAKSRDISLQFLTEATTMTFIGGIIGVLLGWGAATILQKTGTYTTQVTWSSVVLAFCVAALVGIVFGFYPARRAARLRPIEALKYE